MVDATRSDEVALGGPITRSYPSRAAVAGHPIHPTLVPVPIGLLAGAFVSDMLWLKTRDEFFVRGSRMLTTAGIAAALTAAPFGVVDFLSIRKARQRPEAWAHGLGNVAVLIASSISLAFRAGRRDIPAPALALCALSAAGLSVTGFLGGELSYRHRIGVLPGMLSRMLTLQTGGSSLGDEDGAPDLRGTMDVTTDVDADGEVDVPDPAEAPFVNVGGVIVPQSDVSDEEPLETVGGVGSGYEHDGALETDDAREEAAQLT